MKARRPYVRWTEADILCAMGDLVKAKQVLIDCLERDGRSKHKSLIRIARIDYLLGDLKGCGICAKKASSFFHEKWGGPLHDGLFWQALCAYRLEEYDKALDCAGRLKAHHPNYPKLDMLLERLSSTGCKEGKSAERKPFSGKP